MRISSTGNVGIGTDNPASLMHLKVAGTTGSNVLSLENDANKYDFRLTSANLVIRDGSSDRVTLDSSGQVGIGTSSPASQVDISKESGGDSVLSLTSAGVQRHQIIQKGTGDASLVFYNQTAATEAMRIDSSQNLLVGTTSTTGRTDASSGEGIALSAGSYGGFIGATRSGANPLALNRLGSDGAIATFAKTGTSVGSIGSWSQSGTSRISMTNPNGNGFGIFRDSSTVAQIVPMSTSGNGDATHSLGRSDYRWKDLYLSGGVNITDASSPTIRLIDSTNTNTLLMYAQNSTSHIGTYSNHPLVFDTNSAPAMRIDTSGNLLVGTTDSNPTNNSNGDTGFVARQDGTTTVATNNSECAILNRQGTDGNLITFKKDGAATAVGSIGIESAGFTIDGEAGHTGLRFGAAQLVPRDNGADTNGLTDLGFDQGRFRDLYLSGGAYLGGTAAANKLDDYEEGTWTPTLVGNTTAGTYAIAASNCSYTKIGRQVTIQGELTMTVTSAGTGLAKFGGLPFISDGGPAVVGNVRLVGITLPASALYMVGSLWTTSTTDFTVSAVKDNASPVSLDISGISTGDVVRISMTYFTS